MKLGDFKLNRIYTGDARELARGIPDESVDLVFTDPPWGINFQYANQYEDDPESYPALVQWIVKESARVLKPGGFAFVYQATKRLRETWQWFPEHSRLFASCKNFVQIKGLPVEFATDFIVFWQKPGEGKARGMVRDWNRANTANTSRGSRGLGFRVKTSPPRPLDAAFDIVSQMCRPGGIVVDFFAGSGTTAVACRISGLQYLAFELDPGTAVFARQRVANTQMPLVGLLQEMEQRELKMG